MSRNYSRTTPPQKVKVFLSWSGTAGLRFAEGLKETFLTHPSLSAFISSQDIEIGIPHYQKLEEQLREVQVGIGCLTPISAETSQWFNFEAGFLRAEKKPFKILRFCGTTLSGQFEHIQASNITSAEDKEPFTRLLRELLKDDNISDEAIRDWVDFKFERWKKFFHEVNNLILPERISQEASKLTKTIKGLEGNEHLKSNKCLQEMFILSLKEINKQLEIRQEIPTAASLYPYYLITLQKKTMPAIVKAVAMVGQEEHFWQGKVGEAILESAAEDSTRIFVFTKEDTFDRYYDQIIQHAEKYNVYAISLPNLSKIDANKGDFSILQWETSKILATYRDSDSTFSKNMIFTSAAQEIAEYEQIFERIRSASVNITLLIANGNQSKNRKDIIDRVFKKNGLSEYPERKAEMSTYINILAYDEHEEKHAYFQEMMDRMIQIFLKHQSLSQRNVPVLEFGAGTGIFTKRLANQKNISQLTAVEIDWACHSQLSHKFPEDKYPHIKTFHEDSRMYDPSGKFDYIFSSFADHHIRLSDKEQYFDNVKRNLNPNGLFIVGDEFLREHDPNNDDDWKAALKAYHEHIIEIAKQQGEHELVKFEQKAWDSGLKREGDFKMSCTQYESSLKKAGFKFRKEKIGPLDRDDIGGVYVFIASLEGDFSFLD
jgi:SAM-dependent methyltransferase